VSRRLLTIGAILTCGLSALLWGQVRSGSEFRINSSTLFAQAAPSVAVGPDGGFVVVWESYGQDGSCSGVFGKRYGPGGTPLTGDFPVSAYTTGCQGMPRIAMDDDGGFVVVWEDGERDGSQHGIFGRLFDSAGSPAGGDFQVNTYTTSRQRTPEVAMAGSGEFVVVWQSYLQDGFAYGVFGQRFSPTGSPQGAEFRVNTAALGYQYHPSVAMDDSAGFVVVWNGSPDDNFGDAVRGQRYDGNGAALGGNFVVNTHTFLSQISPSVAGMGSGEFVVVWLSPLQDGSGLGVFGQRYDNSGARAGGEFQVNTFATGDQYAPVVAMDAGGNFVVAWESYDESASSTNYPIGIFAQRFEAGGARIGTEFQVNTYATHYQREPAVATDDEGHFVVAWQSYLQDGSSYGVFAQRYEAITCLSSPAAVADLDLKALGGGASLQFTWTNTAGADDYVVYESGTANGAFSTITGSASGGTTGLTLPMPSGNRFYLIAARSLLCGEGPLK
jgi:hypothetical protein